MAKLPGGEVTGSLRVPYKILGGLFELSRGLRLGFGIRPYSLLINSLAPLAILVLMIYPPVIA